MTAMAGDFPSKAVTIIVPYSAGGGTDNFVRAFEQPLEKAMGVDVVVRNIAGGGGAIGAMKALAARPDGYTVTIPNNAFYTLQGMGNVSFKYTDFDYIARVATEPYVLTVANKPEWSTLEGFIDNAKKAPVRIGFSGVGSSTHIMTIAIMQALGIDAQMVPYGGGSQVLAAALGGHIDGLVLNPSDVASAVEGNKLVSIGSTGKTSLLPDVPLFVDHGIKLDAIQWRGIAASAGLDADVKAKWVEAIKVAVEDPAFQKAVGNLGADVSPLYGQELDQFVKSGAELLIPLTQEVAKNK